MPLAFLLLAVTGAQPAPTRLAVPSFSCLNIEVKAATFYVDHFAQQLGAPGLKVTSMNEISALLGLERQRQLLNCATESTSCIAELAAALGVDGMVRGSIGRFDDAFQVNLKVISSVDAETLGAWSRSVKGERELIDALTAGAEALRKDVLKAIADRRAAAAVATAGAKPVGGPATVDTAADAPSGGFRRWAWAPTAVGALSSVAGVVFLARAEGRVDALKAGNRGEVGTDPLQYANDARGERSLGIVGVSVGLAGLAAGAAMFLMGGGAPDDEIATFAVIGGPGVLGVSARGAF